MGRLNSAPLSLLNIVYPAALTLIILSLFENSIKNENVYKSAIGALVKSLIKTVAAQGLITEFIYTQCF